MLIPLTRQTFESLIPKVATGAQYVYCWGKLSDFLRRLLISVVGVTVLILGLGLIIGPEIGFFRFLLGIIIGLYWLWGPVLWASLRNLEYRKFSYSGFWQGKVLDVYVTEELIGQEETVNERGDLVIVENRERCINIEVGDESGFSARVRAPLKRNHQAIAPGDTAQMIVMSNRGDLSRINQTSDVYIPDHNIWVSDYPCLQREEFIEVSRRLRSRARYEQWENDEQQDWGDPPGRPPQPQEPYQNRAKGGSIERVPMKRKSPRRRSSRRKATMDW
ncbi:phosphate ABC transporter permease [Leptothermofonsia sichuanensis E412]|uniref:phosphate ABC transporter permease n=1 Tax=Leptothermofonsia sichuanensis TaxID=2917832 RepID=UPI001CA63FD7|nr:phosphate ABC transporter permease [Leptothermofonsia sichuanensis]QZZ20473.1 phosphate ABC transporter permease [Leptothermofonsia sichuanensis E412]